MSLRRVLCLLVFVDVWISLVLVTGGCRREAPAQETPAAVAPGAAALTATATAAQPEAEARAKAEAQAAPEGETTCGKQGESCGGGCKQWDQAAGEVARRQVPADAIWRSLVVEGMTCGGCERRIIANVGAIDGILQVEANSELGQVRLAMARGSEGRLTDAARSRIEELGYRVVTR